jgi:hypothetical protein
VRNRAHDDGELSAPRDRSARLPSRCTQAVAVDDKPADQEYHPGSLGEGAAQRSAKGRLNGGREASSQDMRRVPFTIRLKVPEKT